MKSVVFNHRIKIWLFSVGILRICGEKGLKGLAEVSGDVIVKIRIRKKKNNFDRSLF